MGKQKLVFAEVATARERLEDAIANQAIEGIEHAPEELAVFRYMIESGMSPSEQERYLADYLSGEVTPPALEPAE